VATRVRMPPLGQTSDEIRIVAWRKTVGDVVSEGEVLLEVETDKATLEIEASATGVLLSVLHSADVVVTAGTTIGWIGTAGEEIPADAPAAARAQRVLATPATRALAREHGIELEQIRGSGPGGRIERADVLAATQAGARPQGDTAAPNRVSDHRQAVAARVTRAAAVPQFSLATTVDCTNALEQLAVCDGATITHLLLQAVASSLRVHPALNQVWSEPGPTLRSIEPLRVGLAVAADDRLLVPTVAEPDALPLEALATAVRGAVAEARAGRISLEHQGPAAITVSNLGMFGIDWFQAIVDPDQSSILAAGAVVERPVVTAAGIVARPQLELVLTVDHRVADGAGAARFLQTVKSTLE
jgi:pyruvate dehydrogenase E2 component (dihydrolipoamide acetyltransferase)